MSSGIHHSTRVEGANVVCKSSAPIITLSPLNIKVNTLQNTHILFHIIFLKAFFNGFIDDDGTGGEKLRGKCE